MWFYHVVLPWVLYFLFVFVFRQPLAALYSCMPSYHIFTDKIFRAHCES